MNYSEVFSVGLFIFRYAFAEFHTFDPMVIEYAVIRMEILMFFEIFNAIGEIMSGALRGLGYALCPTILSVIFVCGVRVLWVLKVFPVLGTYAGLVWVYPVSWMGIAFSTLIAYCIINRKLMNDI